MGSQADAVGRGGMQGGRASRQDHLQKVHFHWLVREPAAPRCVLTAARTGNRPDVILPLDATTPTRFSFYAPPHTLCMCDAPPARGRVRLLVSLRLPAPRAAS